MVHLDVSDLRGGLDEESYRSWYAEKRKAIGRERTRCCRARKADRAEIAVQAAFEVSEGVPITLERSRVRASRISANIAKEMANFAYSRLQHFDSNIQQLTFQKFFGNSHIKRLIPASLSNLDTFMLQESVLSSVKEGLKDHLVGVKPSKIVMAKDILCTLASSSQVGSGRGLAGLLGVDRRNISKARSRGQILDAGHDAFWLHRRRSIQSDSLADNVKLAVQQWWANETNVSPNRMLVVPYKLLLRVLEFYSAFKGRHPNLVCSLSSFENLKPWWVKCLKIWNTCCCRYHQELIELIIALDIMRADKQGVHLDCNCHCDMVCGSIGCGAGASNMCNAHRLVYERLSNLWTSILCEKPELSMWHKAACLRGMCADCGVKLLRVCPFEMTFEKMVKWKPIGYKVVGTTDEGNPKKAATVEYRESLPWELILSMPRARKRCYASWRSSPKSTSTAG